jgi:hypothetical protein
VSGLNGEPASAEKSDMADVIDIIGFFARAAFVCAPLAAILGLLHVLFIPERTRR